MASLIVRADDVFARAREESPGDDTAAMIEAAGGGGFVFEALQLSGIEDGCERQHLERDTAAHRDLFHFINDTHPTTADFVNDAEVTEDTGFVH